MIHKRKSAEFTDADMMIFLTETEGVTDHGSVHYLLSLNLPVDHQDTAEGQESIKAKLNAIRNKLVRQVSDITPVSMGRSLC